MRMQQNKLVKGRSTKAERRFMEQLKKLHIPFRTKVKIQGREVDFICGHYAIDIDGHEQNKIKNNILFEEGYTPIHIDNNSVNKINISFLK